MSGEGLLGRHARLFRELGEIRRAIRNWARVSAAGYLYKSLSLPPSEITVVTRNGSRIHAPLRPNAGALHPILQVFAAGAYEYGWSLEPDPVVIDIGAHIGSFLVWLAEKNPGLRGVAYEPDPAAREYLVLNLRANGLSGIEMRAEAVADRTAEARLYRPLAGGGVSSLHAPGSASGDSVPATVVAFDDVVARIAGDISLLKLDCEGAEYDIVLRSKPDSWRRIKRVVVEYHPIASEHPADLLKRFTELGFTCVKGGDRLQRDGSLWLEREAARDAVRPGFARSAGQE